jgi:hypothetical protein
MRGCVVRRAAAIGSLILLVVAAAEARHPGDGGNTGSRGPINTISAGTLAEDAAAVGCEFIRLSQLDDAALLTAAEQGKRGHSIRSVGSVSLTAVKRRFA